MTQQSGKRWQKLLQNEHDQRMRLEEMVEQLAKQHSSLEKRARKSLQAAQHVTIPASASHISESTVHENTGKLTSPPSSSSSPSSRLAHTPFSRLCLSAMHMILHTCLV